MIDDRRYAMRVTRLLVIASAFAVATQGKTVAQNKPDDDCGVAAFQDYNGQNLALLQEGTPLLSVEGVIAQRRLEEQFCLRFVQCALGNMATDNLRFKSAFSSCLQDEALEKYDAVPRGK